MKLVARFRLYERFYGIETPVIEYYRATVGTVDDQKQIILKRSVSEYGRGEAVSEAWERVSHYPTEERGYFRTLF